MPLTKTTTPAPKHPTWGNVIRLHPWSAAEQREALQTLLASVEADPRGSELAGYVREILQRP